MKNNLLIWALVLAVLSAACAIYGLGSSFDSLITPRSNYGHLDKVSGDGWIEDGAEIRFNDLASRGNRVNIQFTAWRPAGVEANTISIELCGKKIDEFVLSADLERRIFLSSDCEPRTLVIHGSNSFHGSATDRRNLIAQIKSVRLGSRLGVPVPQVSWLAITFLLIFSASFLVLLALELPILYPLSLLIAPSAAYLLQLSPQGDYRNVLAAGMCISMLAAGMAIARKMKGDSDQSTALTPSLARIEFIALAVVIGFGAALRFYGIDFGLPANFHPDEVPKVNAIMRMVEYGDLNPRYFLHPSFLLYCTYFTNKLLQLFGIGWEFRDSAFLAGRIVSALAGSLSLVLLFAIGRRLFGTWSGIMAAAFLAVFPLHVTCSRYLKEDSLLVFVILSVTICVIKAAQEDRKWILLLAGFLAGVSAGTKYSGLLSGAIVATAPWIRSKKIIPDLEYLLWTFAALCLMPLGFLATTPYAIGNFEKFSKDFGSESRHMSRGHTTTVTAWSQFWMYHFGRSLREGMTTIALLAATLSAGFLARRARIQDWFVVSLILLFYLPAEYVKAKPAPQP